MIQTNSILRVKPVQSIGIILFFILFSLQCSSIDNPVKPPKVDAPVLLSPLDNATGQSGPIILKWTVVPDADFYEIQVSTDDSFSATAFHDSTLTKDSTAISGLRKNTLYFWRVRAKNGQSISPWTGTWKFTTRIASPDLLFPVNGAIGQPTKPTLLWNKVAGATSYHIQLSSNASFSSTITNDSTVIDTLKNSSMLSYATTYYWRVASIKNSSERADWSSVWSFTTMTDPTLSVPTLVSPEAGATNQPMSVQLLWSSVAGAAFYELQVSTDSSFAALFYTNAVITQPSTTIDTLSGSTTYYWRVRAKNPNGVSGWSHTFSFETTVTMISIAVSPNFTVMIGGGGTPVPGTIQSDDGITSIAMKIVRNGSAVASPDLTITFSTAYAGQNSVDLSTDLHTVITARTSAAPGTYRLIITVTANKVSLSDSINFNVAGINSLTLDSLILGSNANTAASTIDLDSGILYTAGQVTESSAGLIDLCYGNSNGEDRFYVPQAAKYGTVDNKTIKTVAEGLSFTNIWPETGYSPIVRINSITADQFDTTTSQAAVQALWDPQNEFVLAPVLAEGDCYLVRTSAGAFVLIKVLSLSPGTAGTVVIKYAR